MPTFRVFTAKYLLRGSLTRLATCIADKCLCVCISGTMAAPVQIHQVTGENLLPFVEKELPPNVLDEVEGNALGPVLKAQVCINVRLHVTGTLEHLMA